MQPAVTRQTQRVIRWFDSIPTHETLEGLNTPAVPMAERPIPNREAAGSIPARRASNWSVVSRQLSVVKSRLGARPQLTTNK